MQSELSSTRYLAARWVLPICSEPIEDGVVALTASKITAVAHRSVFASQIDNTDSGNFKDYGEAILLPGLINVHTHLDFSALKYCDTLSSFCNWIENLLKRFRNWNQVEWLKSATLGAREIMLSGTTCVVDSSYSGAAALALAQYGIRGIVGLELFGVREDQAAQSWETWLAKFDSFVTAGQNKPGFRESIKNKLLTLTVAPHAPYTVCPGLMKRAINWAEQRNVLALIHIAESVFESNWLASTDPEMDNFLLKAVPGLIPRKHLFWKGKGLTPVMHLNEQGLLSKAILAAHAIRLNQQDIEILSQHQVKVAHCPRSNARLRNGIAPLKKLLNSNIPVGFGTDSAASSDDLNVLTEALFAWNLQRAIDPTFDLTAKEAVFHLTSGAAKAAGLDNIIGTLEVGKCADIAVFTIDNARELVCSHPYDLLLHGGTTLCDLFVDGHQIVKGGAIIEKN